LLCYLGPADRDEVLREAAQLCDESGADLSVVLPVIDARLPDGCCGIQGEHWRRLMNEETRDAAERAERLLEGWGRPPSNLVVEVGASVSDVVSRAAERLGCDVVAVSRKRRRWSTSGLPRRELQALDRATPGTVLELAGTGRAELV
jgi:nucleotide-binding universal stress UspA family protein